MTTCAKRGRGHHPAPTLPPRLEFGLSGAITRTDASNVRKFAYDAVPVVVCPLTESYCSDIRSGAQMPKRGSLPKSTVIVASVPLPECRAYASTMVAYADRVRRGWSPGAAVDVSREMSRLTLLIVGKTLFDADVESHARDVGDAMSGLMDSFWTLMLPFGETLQRLPIPHMRRGRKARERLDAIIYGIIRERRANLGDRGDLLSMLLMAQDDEDRGRGMTDRQVRDEAMTIFLAGHETTANALTWTWYLLSQSPEVERRLHAEIDRVLEGRLPTVADVDRLPYTNRVVTESMRLYPPAWLVGRRAINQYSIGPYYVPPRSIIIMSQWIVQRDRRHYADPERFDPDRWTPAFKAALPRFAYFPFGGGPRQCIGESFAWMELVLLVATLAQQWRFDLVPGHPVVPQAAVTLRPKYGMKMVANVRQPR
jgi:cytochrome P450